MPACLRESRRTLRTPGQKEDTGFGSVARFCGQCLLVLSENPTITPQYTAWGKSTCPKE